MQPVIVKILLNDKFKLNVNYGVYTKCLEYFVDTIKTINVAGETRIKLRVGDDEF
jgi:hypothetical protein